MGRADCPPHVANELATTTSEATERATTDDVVNDLVAEQAAVDGLVASLPEACWNTATPAEG